MSWNNKKSMILCPIIEITLFNENQFKAIIHKKYTFIILQKKKAVKFFMLLQHKVKKEKYSKHQRVVTFARVLNILKIILLFFINLIKSKKQPFKVS